MRHPWPHLKKELCLSARHIILVYAVRLTSAGGRTNLNPSYRLRSLHRARHRVGVAGRRRAQRPPEVGFMTRQRYATLISPPRTVLAAREETSFLTKPSTSFWGRGIPAPATSLSSATNAIAGRGPPYRLRDFLHTSFSRTVRPSFFALRAAVTTAMFSIISSYGTAD